MAGLIGFATAVIGAVVSVAFVVIGWRWLRDPSILRRAGEAMGHTGLYNSFVARALPALLLVFGLVTAALVAAAVVSAIAG